ncbi:MAG: hypothetical protein H7321_00425, partial [Bacteroidia bacterium]|nr:hypothetical protein [Bacteroidia bacterium]
LSIALGGKTHSQTHIDNYKASMKDYKHSDETKKKIAQTLTGRKKSPLSESTKDKIRLSNQQLPLVQCQICKSWVKSITLNRWHNNRCSSYLKSLPESNLAQLNSKLLMFE